MNRVAEFQWQDAVQDAVHERDPAKLEAKIKREIAIFRRIHTFRSLWGDVEGQGLFDAAHHLFVKECGTANPGAEQRVSRAGLKGCATCKWKLSCPTCLPVIFKLAIEMAAA